MDIDWAALGTWLAVLVALFGDVAKRRLIRPKLVVSLVSEEGQRVGVQVNAPDGASRQSQARFYHLRVENRRRWVTATNVQVVLLQLSEPDQLGVWAQKFTTPLVLRWRGWEAFGPGPRTLGAPADVDLLSALQDQDQTKAKWLEIHTVIQPVTDELKRRLPCKLRLSVQALSTEVDSTPLHIEVGWNGRWSDDATEMKQHLTVATRLSNPG